MSFQFSLSPVLWLRGVVQEREERLLQQILQEIAATTELLDDVAAEMAAAAAARSSDHEIASNAAHLQAWYEHVESLRFRRRDLEQKIAKLEELREKQMLVYQAAQRDHQMLDDMREQGQAQYDALSARREQRILDDRFGSQRARR